MAIQNYATQASRNLINASSRMLKYAEPIQVLGTFGLQEEQPLRKTDTVVFRRLKPFNATAAANPASGYSETPSIVAANFITAEGTTPTANTIGWTDISVTLEQYAVLYKFSSKSELMYEDNIPDNMLKRTAKDLAEVAELVAYGVVRAGTSVIYANGSTRAAVNTTITLPKLRQAARAMEANRASKVTSAIKPGLNFGTVPVEESYIVFMHTDMSSDVRELPGFVKRVEYGSAISPVHAREIGACEEFRFVTSPLFTPFLAGGAAVAGTGMVSAGAANCDVYPMIVMAEEAWGHVSLKGHGKPAIKARLIPSTEINHANPSGMFGYVGANFWYAAVRLNENWMTRIETCASSL